MSAREIAESFTPSEDENAWARSKTTSDGHLLALVVLLKCYQRLGYFPKLGDVPDAVVTYVRSTLGVAESVVAGHESERTLWRHREFVRTRLGVVYEPARVRAVAEKAVRAAALTKDNPADLINVALEELVRQSCELPGYTTLDAMTTSIRTQVNSGFFSSVAGRVPITDRARLARLLLVDPVSRRSEFDRLKAPAKAASLGKFRKRLEHLAALDSLGATEVWLAGVPPGKVGHFAGEARVTDVADLRTYGEDKRLTLLVSLIHVLRTEARDEVCDMFCYIALFSHFIPCGVWEAVYLLDGLLQNSSDIQPDVVHADTQGQSLPVFGLATLLGFELLPRIRHWHDLIFYRPDPRVRYSHIDALFGDHAIDWDLIEKHWPDLLRTGVSIREGRLSSVTLLRRLGNHSRKNRLYKAFRELGRVVRTITLLRFLSEPELRQQITAITNRVEAFHGFAAWLMIGGKLIGHNDPDHQERVVKFNELVANCAIDSTALDITAAANSLAAEGYPVDPDDLATITPTSREPSAASATGCSISPHPMASWSPAWTSNPAPCSPPAQADQRTDRAQDLSRSRRCSRP
uniref:Tn3 family transposase n=1 Tax=Nocardia seriolae TaxID=37332 RepID=UPI001F218E23|nr:Tn3 family transposase [Nocardia seriolae]